MGKACSGGQTVSHTMMEIMTKERKLEKANINGEMEQSIKDSFRMV